MAKIPTPEGYTGSKNDDDILMMRQGTGGRISYDPKTSLDENISHRGNFKDDLGSDL